MIERMQRVAGPMDVGYVKDILQIVVLSFAAVYLVGAAFRVGPMGAAKAAATGRLAVK